MPIPNSLDARTLLRHLEQIVEGLISRGIHVASYACDGTEVERSVQRLLMAKATTKIEQTIRSNHVDFPDTKLMIAVFHGQPIVMIQDSKHALKTFRNNLFSGARLLTLGNFTAIYQRIRDIAFEDGSPLYHRDVEKLDRQDDNAAARLFSSATLEYLAIHHASHIGEIVYLFVFGELVDAYQNRHIPHCERVKLVLRARYFLDMWETYLDAAGYKRSQYYLSREAADIARVLIEGYLALVIVYRDYNPSGVPCLPWLHSSETCEHVFGEARRIIKDFTMLDFFHMASKLTIKIRQAVLHAHSPNGKARANGYAHTYFDTSGIHLSSLNMFPSDDEMNDIANQALQEAQSLVTLLGIYPVHLARCRTMHVTHPTPIPPPIDTGYREGEDWVYEVEEESEALTLQGLLIDAEALFESIGKMDQMQLQSLINATLALTADDMLNVCVIL
jgi:hypothetical protein